MLAVVLQFGCAVFLHEGLPSWKVEDITIDQVPNRVRKAIFQIYPSNNIARIERSTFQSRIQGYPKQFRFTAKWVYGAAPSTILDESGTLLSSDFWFQIEDK